MRGRSKFYDLNTRNLYPFQIPAAEHLLRVLSARNAALDGSDCGVGKTAIACAVIRELDLSTLVIPPKICVSAWERMGNLFGVQFDVLNPEMLRTGKTPFGVWQNPRPARLKKIYFCAKCQRQLEVEEPRACIFGDGIHEPIEKTQPHKHGKFIWHPGVKFLVFDEVHRFAGDGLQGDMLIAAKRQGIKILALSATAADNPLQLGPLGYVLGLHGLVGDDSFWRFAYRNGCRRSPFGGLAFTGNEIEKRARMSALHRQIFPDRGVRVRISDLPEFPECSIHAELYDFGDKERIDRLYASMTEAISALKGHAVNDKDSEHPLTKLLRARETLELLKVPLYCELAQAAVEAGQSVAFFVAFKSTVEELCKRLNIRARIVGGQTAAARQAAIQSFQDDAERMIVSTADAGGVAVSLHDVRGQFPRLGIGALLYSSVKTRQYLGRLPRIGGKSKSRYIIPLAAGTCEERIHRAISAKLNNLDALNDEDLQAANLPLRRADWPEGL